MGAPSKFSSIRDAAQYVNEELQRRSLLPASRKLQFQTIDEVTLEPHLARINNDKLIINTFHKLLKRLEELESRDVAIDVPRDSSPLLKSSIGSRTKPILEKKIAKPWSRQPQVSARRNEVMLEQLRARLKLDGPDLTWSTRPVPEADESQSKEATNDSLTVLLKALAMHKSESSAALLQTVEFLHNCNGYLYTRCVHNCECQVPLKVQLRVEEDSPDQELHNSEPELRHTLDKLQELMNDWYDIAQLLEKDGPS
ncbi:LAME_0G09890g1_1 [Lachancea meyersii CBS 8951]|uniref:LAME_0G09890g1_1 n=1 Tax=Lachancea meyersii CBS 8951 TaxID=1266667 RepID=A0A1G4K8S0_9SACH|nr:LAME_0G09890g1_1 [Lachancea meyersii CBS 8951]